MILTKCPCTCAHKERKPSHVELKFSLVCSNAAITPEIPANFIKHLELLMTSLQSFTLAKLSSGPDWTIWSLASRIWTYVLIFGLCFISVLQVQNANMLHTLTADFYSVTKHNQKRPVIFILNFIFLLLDSTSCFLWFREQNNYLTISNLHLPLSLFFHLSLTFKLKIWNNHIFS